jgi:hypothetical protein
MNIVFIIKAVEDIDEAIRFTIDPKERAELKSAGSLLRTTLRKRGVFIGEQADDKEMPWCMACKSYHVVPRSEAHHNGLKCFKPWKKWVKELSK